MKINRVKGVGCHYMDENGIVLSNAESQGIGDSLGRTAVAAMVYVDNRNELLEGIWSNFRYIRTSPETGSHWYISRYPVGEEWAAVGSSRDHVMYAISTLKRFDNLHKDHVENLAKRPCIDHAYTIDQKIWFKALYSNFWSYIYGILMTSHLKVTQALKWVVRAFGGNGDKVLPTYAVFYSLWGLPAIRNGRVKRWLKGVYLPHFENSNYVARMLCDDYVTKAEVDGYVPTRKNRWTTRLDREGNRDMTQYPEDTPENNVELGLLYYLYERQSKQGTDEVPR